MQQYTQVLFFAAIIAVFYFLIIRPQKKRQNDQLELMRRLEPGAEILTIGGIYGTIVSVDDDRVRIAVADGSELEMVKRAIAQIVEPSAGEDDEDAETDDDEPGSEQSESDGGESTPALVGESGGTTPGVDSTDV